MDSRDEYRVTTDDLGPDDCWRLIAAADVGRIALADDDGPTALPVNYAVYGGRVVFRTSRGSALDAHRAGAAVAFEVDHTDHVAESGWSVIVRGHLLEVTDADEIHALGDLSVHPWVAGDHDVWLCIVPTMVTGRITSRRRIAPFGPGVSYMPPD